MTKTLLEYHEIEVKYKAAEAKLRAERDAEFPYHSVAVHGGQHVIVTLNGDCPADKVACMFCNHNVWWKKIEDVTPERDKSKWPRWIKEYLLDTLPGRREAIRKAEWDREWKERHDRMFSENEYSEQER